MLDPADRPIPSACRQFAEFNQPFSCPVRRPCPLPTSSTSWRQLVLWLPGRQETRNTAHIVPPPPPGRWLNRGGIECPLIKVKCSRWNRLTGEFGLWFCREIVKNVCICRHFHSKQNELTFIFWPVDVNKLQVSLPPTAQK